MLHLIMKACSFELTFRQIFLRLLKLTFKIIKRSKWLVSESTFILLIIIALDPFSCTLHSRWLWVRVILHPKKTWLSIVEIHYVSGSVSSLYNELLSGLCIVPSGRVPESRQHLFAECRFTRWIWAQMSVWIGLPAMHPDEWDYGSQ